MTELFTILIELLMYYYYYYSILSPIASSLRASPVPRGEACAVGRLAAVHPLRIPIALRQDHLARPDVARGVAQRG